MRFDRSTYHYKSRCTDPAILKKRIREICETHVRYGYRRVFYILRRDGWGVNMKKVYRLYRELGLQLRNKAPKRRVKAKLREDRTTAIRPSAPPLPRSVTVSVPAVIRKVSIPALPVRLSFPAPPVSTLAPLLPNSAMP